MPISFLRINDFRNLAAVELTPCTQGLNILYGENGSGKTSVLEAIHYLGVGRSFRSSHASRLIRLTTEKFSLFAQLLSENRQVPAGVEKQINGTHNLRIAEENVSSISELAYILPIRLINSQSHQLLEAGPAFRRKYLDWGLFYQTESFLAYWRQYDRILRQRNAILKEKRSKKELDVWTHKFVNYGLELDKLRREYIQLLTPLVADLSQELLAMDSLKIKYACGWKETEDLAFILEQSYQEEYRFGHTQFGPHRADFDIQNKGISVKHFLSRGQQKLLICAMILAQGMLLAKQTNKRLTYLVDDLPSELDIQSRKRLIALLSKQQTQVFITAVDSEMICELLAESSVATKVFHVEHGRVDLTTVNPRADIILGV